MHFILIARMRAILISFNVLKGSVRLRARKHILGNTFILIALRLMQKYKTGEFILIEKIVGGEEYN